MNGWRELKLVPFVPRFYIFDSTCICWLCLSFDGLFVSGKLYLGFDVNMFCNFHRQCFSWRVE
ncbi:hypothetical protein Bca4012_057360 [Brassica carinata]